MMVLGCCEPVVDCKLQSFTRWINGFIAKRGLRVENLETDLNDGVILINLLEILTGKTIVEKYYKAPKNRTYMIANHSIALSFMGQHKLATANCSSQDLADGRLTMLMGLIWSLIRHFSLKGSGKHALTKSEILSWCKSMVDGYRNIRFDGSPQCFQDGLIFCALIHKYDPSFLDYDSLDINDAVGNMRTALSIAEAKLNMPHFTEQYDANEDFLDERTILTYLPCTPLFLKIYNEYHRIFAVTKISIGILRHFSTERRKRLFQDPFCGI